MLFFTTSFNLILPELNNYIELLDGAHLKGLTIGLFTISAGVSRPFSGKLADTIGRKKVMLIGILTSITVCSLYPLSTLASVWFFLFLRFMHGFSNGFYATGASALITDILPENMRGRGMGLWGTFISLGFGFGNGLSSLITNVSGINGLFFAAAFLAAMAWVLLLSVKETLPDPQTFQRQLLLIKKDEIVERDVTPVAVVMFLSAICSGIIFVLSPDIAEFLHIKNKGWFFIWYVVTTIGMRLFMGKLSDRFGRRETLLTGMILLVVSMVMIGLANNIFWFTLSALLFGVATGITSPTIFAWTADLSPDHRRGIGAGTMFIALEFGILFGSIITNMIYTNKMDSVLNVFLFGGTMAFLCVGYLIWHLWKRDSLT